MHPHLKASHNNSIYNFLLEKEKYFFCMFFYVSSAEKLLQVKLSEIWRHNIGNNDHPIALRV